MGTPMMYRTLQLTQFFQEKILRQKYVVIWNSEAKKLFYREPKELSFLFYGGISTLLTHFLMAIFFILMVIMGNIRLDDLTKAHGNQIVLTFFTTFLLAIALCADLIYLTHGHELVEYLNTLIHFDVDKNHKGVKPHLCSSSKWRKVSSKDVDFVGLFAWCIALNSGLLAFPVTVLVGTSVIKCTMFHVLYQCIHTLLHVNPSIALLGCSLLIHYLLATSLVLSANVGVPFIIFVPVIHLRQLQNIEGLLIQALRPTSFKEAVKSYQQLRLTHIWGQYHVGLFIAMVMSIGYYFMILSIPLCIKGWTIVSTLAYPLVLFATLVGCFLIFYSLQLVDVSYHFSEDFIIKLKLYNIQTSRGGQESRLYFEKVLRSVRPTGFYAGCVGVLDRDRVVTYIWSMFESSADILLCLRMFGETL